jgi:predicted nuclease of predicted toxin-antitoxin system
MRFLVDENVGPTVARWLATNGHDVFSVYEQARGSDDAAVLGKAHGEQRILITGDKDFGDKVYRQHLPHCGIVLLRLEDERSSAKIATLRKLLDNHATALENRFVVVTEKQVRFAAP